MQTSIFIRRITRGLRRRGMDIVTVQERHTVGNSDEFHLETAAGEGRVMLTNDDDFLAIDAFWQANGKTHAGIVYWNQNKYSIGQAIALLLDYLSQTPTESVVNSVKFL